MHNQIPSGRPTRAMLPLIFFPMGGLTRHSWYRKLKLGINSQQLIYGDDQRHWVEDWSPDGRFLLTHDTKTLSITTCDGQRTP